MRTLLNMHRLFVLIRPLGVLFFWLSVGLAQAQQYYPPEIIGPQACPGSPYIYQLLNEHGGGNTYQNVQWHITHGNGRITSFTNNTCTVVWDYNSTQDYILAASGYQNTQFFSVSSSVFIRFIYLPPSVQIQVTPSVLPTACTTKVYTYQVPAVSGMTYHWDLPAGAELLNGQNTRQIQVRWNATAVSPAKVSVRLKDRSCYSEPVVVQHPIESSPILSAGAQLTVDGQPTQLCAGQTYTFRLSGAIAHATKYTWLLPDATTIATTEPVLTYTLPATSGTLQLVGSNLCGDSEPIELPISILSATDLAQVTLTGPTLICPDRAYPYLATAIPGAIYQWSEPTGVVIRSGQGTAKPTIAFTESAFGSAGTDPVTLSVQVSNPCNSDPPVTHTLMVRLRRAKPVTEVVFAAAQLVPNASNELYLNTCAQTDPVLCGRQDLHQATLHAVLSTGDWHLFPEGTALGSTVSVKLVGYNAAGEVVTIPGLPPSITLTLENQKPEQWYSLPLTTPAQLEAYGRLTRIVATVESASVAAAVASKIQLRVFYAEEFIHIPTAFAPTALTQAAAGGYSYQFGWQAPACPFVAGYEFALVRLYESGTPIDTLIDTKAGLLPALSAIDWKQALTLQTERATTGIELTVAEGTGTYAWRVRALGNQTGGSANPANWGAWSQPATFAFTQPDETTSQPGATAQPGMNWIYSRTFTEGGRVAEQMSFADGLGQPTQTQSKIQSQDQVVLSESRQDYIGRAAIQTLPVPVVNKNRLGFVPNFLTNALGGVYDKPNYDADTTYKHPSPMQLDAAHNGDYYSGNPVSSDSSGIINPYVPSAQGYPFTRTRYATDGTSRVVEQSGVGKDHRLGGGHSVKTYYSSVAEAELLRLFGKEAPLAINAHKTITVDPNGTSSVSYMTKDGKVLATALINNQDPVNPKPYALDTLPSSFEATKAITERLADRTPFGSIGTRTSKSIAFVIPTNLRISYTLTADAIADACRQSSCKTCDYRIEIRVLDSEEPQKPLAYFTRLLPMGSCGTDARIQPLDTVLTGLVGTFLIEKRVTAYNQNQTTNLPPTQPRVSELQTELDALAAYYSEENLLSTPFWQQFKTYLTPDSTANATALYDWLKGLHQAQPTIYPLLTASDGSQYYEIKVPLAENPGQTPPGQTDPDCALTLQIPYIEPVCPKYICPLTGADGLSSLERYFTLHTNNRSLIDVLNQIDPVGWQAGDWDAMANQLFAQGYGCEKIWAAWQAAVEFYNVDPVKVLPPVEVVGVGHYSLAPRPLWLDMFFGSMGAPRVLGVQRDASVANFSLTQDLRRQYYQLFYLWPTDVNVERCRIGLNLPTFVFTPQHENLVVRLDSVKGPQLAACIEYIQPEPLPEEKVGTFKNLLVSQLDSACYRRSEEFSQQLVDAIHAKGQYVQGDRYSLVSDPFTGRQVASGEPRDSSVYAYSRCQLEKMTAACVAYCRKGASLEVLNQANQTLEGKSLQEQILIKAAQKKIEQILLYEFELGVSETPFDRPRCGAEFVELGNRLAPPADSIFVPVDTTLRRVLSLNGNSHHFGIAHSASLSFSDQFSASFWLMRKGGQRFELLHKYSYSNYDGWGIEYYPGYIGIWITSRYFYIPCTLPLHQWTHLVVTHSASELKVYRNGVLIATRESIAIVDNATYPLWNGVGVLNIGKFLGYFDELSLFKHVLSESEVESLYVSRGKTASTLAGVVGVWDFDQTANSVGANSTVIDQSGQGNTLSLYGYSGSELSAGLQSRWQTIQARSVNPADLVAYYTFDGSSGSGSSGSGSSTNGLLVPDVSCQGNQAQLSSGAQITTIGGKIGSSLLGGAGNGAKVVVSDLNWSASNFSVSFWMNPSSLAAVQQIGAGWGSFAFQLSRDGSIQVGTDAAHVLATHSGLVDVGEWQLFTFTFQNGTGTLYKNGEWIGSRTDMALPTQWNNFQMGGLPGMGTGNGTANEGSLVGMLDEVQLYRTVLSRDNIYYLLEATRPLPTKACPQPVSCQQTPPFCFRWSSPLVDAADPKPIPIGDNMVAYAQRLRVIPCEQIRATALLAAIARQIDSVRDAHLLAYREQYQTVCGGQENLRDTLNLSYALGYHHYTLYYYDRAGNLIRTVPPAGVDLLDEFSVVEQADTLPDHRLVTDYVYNSLGQLVEQNTPDGGKTVFFYNNKSQLRFSQNARQVAENHFSYTRYDNLGRVTEVGESSLQASVALQSKVEEMSYPTTGTQVTRTVYSQPSGVEYNPNGTSPLPQRHLQNRVSYSFYEQDTKTHATYYSYDVHGNVEWLVQEIPDLGRKYIKYEYDLISGKVLKVSYQEKTAEQFYHRYSYDEDNRLTGVETSADGTIWEQDATYEYYRHGPLKRMELGEDRVQGVDYTYTIHGWLKAINHPDLTSEHDPGSDGQGIVPQDAFGMALSYYQGDYMRTTQNGGLHQANIQTPAENRSLYNGNIASWTSQTQKASSPSGYPSEGLTAEQYTYEELNRIKSSSFASFENGQYVTKQDYATSYEYDGNGNILKLNRNAYKPQGSALQLEMDRLTYRYYPGTNRLRRVEDAVATADWTEDIESQPGDQEGNNYKYDARGQLIHDEQDMTDITWTVYNKVSTVTKRTPQGGISQLIEYGYDGEGNRISKKVTNKAANPETVTITYYVRDAEGNVLSIYEKQPGALLATQTELYIFGGSRIGVYKPHPRTLNTAALATRLLSEKEYELTDHLGNVRAVVGDERISENGAIRAALRSYYNYYAFGMNMPGRNFLGSSPSRYGFNGQEKESEWGGKLAFDERIYNPALGVFLSTDPASSMFPWLGSYVFAADSPIGLIDIFGMGGGPGPARTAANNTGTRTKTPRIQRQRANARRPLIDYGLPIVRPGRFLTEEEFTASCHGSVHNETILLGEDIRAEYKAYVKWFYANEAAKKVAEARGDATLGAQIAIRAQASLINDQNKAEKDYLNYLEGKVAKGETLSGYEAEEYQKLQAKINGIYSSLKVGYKDIGDVLISDSNGAYAGSGYLEMGILFLDIHTKDTQARGGDVFNALYSKIEADNGVGSVHTIRGRWLSEDNLATFNALIRQGVPEKEAALQTFTGKMASRRGFTVVSKIAGKKLADGTYETATVDFTLPKK